MTDQVALKFLKELVSIYSPSGGEKEAVEVLEKYLSKKGLVTEIDEVGNLVATWGNLKMKEDLIRPDLLFLGHIDTVPGYIPVQEKEGKIYGRGAVDAKGALCAFAMALLRARSLLSTASVVLVGAVGEETEGEGAKHILLRFHPKMVIVGEPSGWEGITLGYKGRLVVDYLVEMPARHPSSPQASGLKKTFVFGRKLSLLVRRFNRGKVWDFEKLYIHPNHISSFTDGLKEWVKLQVTLRLPPGLEQEKLKCKIQDIANGAVLSFRGEEPAYVASKNNLLVRAFLQGIRAEGGKPRFKLKSGTSDMNTVGPVWHCPILAYGPGDSALDHTPYEHISVEEFLKAIRVMERVLANLFGSADPAKEQ